MLGAQGVHEMRPRRRRLVCEFSDHVDLVRIGRAVIRTPLRHGGDDRDEVDALVRQRVPGLLSVRGIVLAGENSSRRESVEPVGQDAACLLYTSDAADE